MSDMAIFQQFGSRSLSCSAPARVRIEQRHPSSVNLLHDERELRIVRQVGGTGSKVPRHCQVVRGARPGTPGSAIAVASTRSPCHDHQQKAE